MIKYMSSLQRNQYSVSEIAVHVSVITVVVLVVVKHIQVLRRKSTHTNKIEVDFNNYYFY